MGTGIGVEAGGAGFGFLEASAFEQAAAAKTNTMVNEHDSRIFLINLFPFLL